MNPVRQAEVAGRFYPADARELETAVHTYLEEAVEVPAHSPRAIIAPHAGYPFSGPIAGSAFATLQTSARRVRRVVLIGPSHYFPFDGVATCGATHFETPLGRVAVDGDAVAELARHPGVFRHDEAHYLREHALETHLPFLQCLFKDFELVPLLVGSFPTQPMRALIETLWTADDTLICVSSDLSHYHPYRDARQLDADTTAAIMNLDAAKVTSTRACGYVAIRGLLEAARGQGLRPNALDIRNSGDTAGSRDSVVGYGAYAFYEA